MSARQVKAEIRQLTAAIQHHMFQFCDSWVVVGIRAGGEHTVEAMHAQTKADKQRLEDVIASIALKIVQKRNKCRGRKRS